MRQMTKLAAALLALAAVGAWGAGAAQAANPSIHFPNGQATGILTGENEVGTVDTLTVPTLFGTAKAECTITTLQGTASQGAEEVTLHPTCSKATFNSEEATWSFNHCAFVLKKGETSAEGHTAVRIECEAGSHITVSTSLCTVEIGEQEGLTKGVHFTNVGGHITLATTVGHIVNSGCSFVNGPGALEAHFTVKAYEDNGNLGTSTTPDYQEGAEIPVEVLNP